MLKGLLIQDGWRAGAIHVGDSTYRLPTEAFITGEAGRWFAQFLQANGVAWTEESLDCEDHAELAAAMMKLSNLKANLQAGQQSGDRDGMGAGIGFGPIRLPTRMHSINLGCHVRDNGAFYTACYEPQRGLSDFGVSDISFRPYAVTAADKATVEVILL